MKQKKLVQGLFLFIIIITSINIAKAQHISPEKGDNVLLIFCDNSDENNFISFGQFLVEKGFSFASKDKDFLSLSTNERTSQGGYKYTLTVSFKDSIISIRPRCNYVLFGSSIGNIKTEWTDWKYAKAKGSPLEIAYRAFSPILREYNGQLYHIQK